MVGFKIAVQTRCLAQSFKKALHIAGTLGCDGVQIDVRHELPMAELSDTGLRQLRKMLDDLNLRISSVVFPTRRGYANPVDLQPRLEATKAAMLFASRLGAKILISNLGPLPSENCADERTVLEGALHNLASHGDRVGVRFVAQSANAPQEVVEWIETLPPGTLALDLHPAHLIAQGESPAEFVSIAGRYVAHVHAVDGVYDLTTRQGVEVELGRGSTDFPNLLGMLEEYGYRDWFTVERNHSRQLAEDIQNAISYLRQL